MARFVDWIWHVRGAVPVPPGVSATEAFDRLDPLFRQDGTRHDRAGDRLTFTKTDQAAQDRMSIFDRGELRFEAGAEGGILRYRLVSRALLLCFLAPFFFLAVAQLTLAIARYEAPSAKEKAEAKAKADAHKRMLASLPANPIDRALGAPRPEAPKRDRKDDDRDEKKPTATPAYVFAGLFALLYVAGRILEDWLIRRLFRTRLATPVA